MTLRNVFLLLSLLGIATAQESAPIKLLGKNPSGICHGKDSDVPDCVTGPRATYSPDPKYPEKERKARHQGAVALDLVVSSDGLPRDVKVLHTLSPEFDKAAVDAVMNWRFTPATKDGNPVAAEIDVQVTFRLR